jgi:DNA-binding transcriptional ArsR family regulator
MDVASADIEALKDKAADAARLLRALSNERRLQVMCLLATSGEMSVGPLADRVDLSQSALSQHLALLREDGLVATRRDGTTIYYRIADGRVDAVLKLLHELYCPELS